MQHGQLTMTHLSLVVLRPLNIHEHHKKHIIKAVTLLKRYFIHIIITNATFTLNYTFEYITSYSKTLLKSTELCTTFGSGSNVLTQV